jgi:hypothetical protein
MSLPDELEKDSRTRELASALENACFLPSFNDRRRGREGGKESEEEGGREDEEEEEEGEEEGYAYLKACLVRARTEGGEGREGGRGGGGGREEGHEGGWEGTSSSPLQAVTEGLFAYLLLPSQKENEGGKEGGREKTSRHPSSSLLLLRACALYHRLLQESHPPSLPPSLPLDLKAIEVGLARALVLFGRHLLLLPSLPPSLPPSLLDTLPSLLHLYETVVLARLSQWKGEGGREGGREGGVEGVVERLVGVAQTLRPFRLAEAYVWASVGRVKEEVVREGGREGGRAW